MAQASFTKDGMAPLEFSVNPHYPGRVTVAGGTVRGNAESGEGYAYEKGAPYSLTELRFEDMPEADYDGGFDYSAKTQGAGTQSLINWFLELSGGEFTYNDPFGRAHAVTFADEKLRFAMTDKGFYEGSVTLREDLD